MATDYDEVRSDVKESRDRSLEALQSANAPDARSVVRELDDSDAMDEAMTPSGEFVADELVREIPQAEGEFTCYSWRRSEHNIWTDHASLDLSDAEWLSVFVV